MTSQKPKHKWGPFLLLLSLLAVQCLVFVFSKWPPKFQGDEKYYVQKALSLRKDVSWRPQGYPLFIALCNFGKMESGNVRYPCAVIQLILSIGLILCFYRLASLTLASSLRLYFVAFLLGVEPWVPGFARRLYPDSLTASLVTFGLLGLFAFVRANSPGATWGFFFLSALLLTSTILLRPEMIAIVPLFFFTALSLKWKERIPFRITITLSIALVAGAGFLSGYHLLSRGGIGLFGKYSLSKPGGLGWVQTWFASERTAFNNFLYGPALNQSKFDSLPERAFSDEYERREIRRACELSAQRKKYDGEVDDIFRKVAEKRRRESFFRHFVLTKMWAVAHIWLNLEGSEQWYRLVPHSGLFFILLVAFFFSLKYLLFSLAALSVFQVFHHQRKERLQWYHALTILMIFSVVARTLLMGGMIGYLHRYAVVAWPAMLWCAVSGCIDLRLSLGSSRFVRK